MFAALLLVACGKDSSGPVAVPTSVAVAVNAATTATVGTVVTPALTFSVKDQNGNSLAGVPVTITVTGGGTIASPATTTTSGETSIGAWTLGTLVGVNTVTIKAGNLAPVTFSITTVAGVPTQIVVSGGGQSALAGSTVSPISIKVADQFGNGVAARPVTITVAEGGGFVGPQTGTTDANGQFAGINWTLGKSALPQTLSVASGSIVGSATATVASSYVLDVRYFSGDPSFAVRTAFENAAGRLKGAIVGTLGIVPFVNVPLGDPAAPNTNCGVTGVTLNEEVRDVIIYAAIRPIDGPGKILGSAGPCLVRSTSRLTIIGVMQFDSDDLQTLATSGRLEAVILHEMAHVLGFGTLWDEKTPTLITGSGGGDPRFTGGKALSECLAAGGTTLCSGGVAVENCTEIPNCGAGTQDSHWREGNGTIAGFRTEMMTGFLSAGILNPFSNMSIQSLGDLGYTVNGLAADPYSVPSPSIQSLLMLDGSSGGVNPRDWEVVRRPIATVSPSGAVTRMERQ